MNDPITPIQPNSGNKAITILRIFLWLMPAIFIPISVIIAAQFVDLIYGNDANTALGLCILGIMIATAAVGYFDQRLALMQKKISPPHSKKELARWTIIFVLAQILIAPTVCWSVLYGYCVVTGNM